MTSSLALSSLVHARDLPDPLRRCSPCSCERSIGVGPAVWKAKAGSTKATRESFSSLHVVLPSGRTSEVCCFHGQMCPFGDGARRPASAIRVSSSCTSAAILLNKTMAMCCEASSIPEFAKSRRVSTKAFELLVPQLCRLGRSIAVVGCDMSSDVVFFLPLHVPEFHPLFSDAS